MKSYHVFVLAEGNSCFIVFSNPSASLGVRLGGDFSEYTLEDEAYISISTNLSVQHHVMRKRVAVWLQLLPELLAASSPPSQQRSTATDQVKDEF